MNYLVKSGFVWTPKSPSEFAPDNEQQTDQAMK